MASSAFNGILAFVTVITMIFCLGNQEEILSNPLQTPFLLVFVNSTGSNAAAVVLTVPIVSTGVVRREEPIDADRDTYRSSALCRH